MSKVSENYVLGYEEGRSDGRDEILDAVFGFLEDERHYWINFPSEYGKIDLIDKISARLDAYVDDMREVWNDQSV